MIEKLNGLPEAFADTGMHYNPEHMEHPEHAGDLPLLLSKMCIRESYFTAYFIQKLYI